jgi:UDP-glucuronate decarboxylase
VTRRNGRPIASFSAIHLDGTNIKIESRILHAKAGKQKMSLLTVNKSHEVIERDLIYICDRLKQEFAAMAGKRLVITGGAGFLGYYLVQAVLYWNGTGSRQDEVQLAVYDNFLRGVPGWLMRLKERDSLILEICDVSAGLPEDMGNFQYIIHAASIASPTYYRTYPIETMDANVTGLRNLLDYSVKQQDGHTPVEGFLFFSSSEIYGNPLPENIPTPETYNGNVSCTGPRACYDESKRYGETLCVNFAERFGIPVKSARPFNNYGPGLKISDRRVIPDFARDVLSGKDIVMLSDGRPTRTFCYVADAIVGYFKILVRGRNGHAFNIGVEAPEISMAELAERVAGFARDLFGYRGKVVKQTSPDQKYLIDNPDRRCPDITKARTELGYEPVISLDEGLQSSLIWYAGNMDEEKA